MQILIKNLQFYQLVKTQFNQIYKIFNKMINKYKFYRINYSNNKYIN